jgi:hypothetical protein
MVGTDLLSSPCLAFLEKTSVNVIFGFQPTISNMIHSLFRCDTPQEPTVEQKIALRTMSVGGYDVQSWLGTLIAHKPMSVSFNIRNDARKRSTKVWGK